MEIKFKEKIIILIIILSSILGITYKVYGESAITGPMLGAWSGTPLPEQGAPMTSVPWYVGKGLTDGIISAKSYSSENATKQKDSGTLSFGLDNSSGTSSSGGGGNAGGGIWNGSVSGFNYFIESSASSFSPNSKGEIWYDDTCNYIDVLCSEQGTAITGKNLYIEDHKAIEPYWETRVEEYEVEPTYSYNEAKETIEGIAKSAEEMAKYQEFYRTSCKYTGTTKKATAAEAFVLSEAVNIQGAGEYTPLQYAWWAVTGTGSGKNELSEAAFAFQNYVDGAEKGGPTSYTVKYEEKDKDGNIVQKEKKFEGGFPIKYKPEFANTDEEYEVVFDEKLQQYIIGPLRIDYYDCDPFALITNIEVYSDNSENPINKDNYYLAIEEGDNKLKKLDNEYPADGEDFYIIMNYNENFKKITDIKVDFKYMNATGSYTLYDGTYTKVCVQGHIFGQFDYNNYKNVKEFSAWVAGLSELGYGIVLESYIPPFSGKVEIDSEKNQEELEKLFTKDMAGKNAIAFVMVNANVTDSSYVYKFSNGKYGLTEDNFWKAILLSNEFHCWDMTSMPSEDEYKMKYPWATDYQAVVSLLNVYLAMSGHNLTFGGKLASCVEVYNSIPNPMEFDVWKDLEYINLGDDYNAQDQAVSGGAARWWQYTTIHWKDNVLESGKVKITKEIQDGKAKDGDVFEFKLTVKDGNNTVGEENLQIVYKNGGDNSVVSKLYEWEVGKTPYTYEIEETKIPEGYTLVNITNQSGSLKNGETIPVTVINMPNTYTGNLSITKIIQDTKLDTSQYNLIGKEYQFEVTISGDCTFTYQGQNYTVTEDNPVTLSQINIKSVAESASQAEKDAATWTLQNVKWNHGYTAKFDVKEVSNEIEGTEEVSVQPSSGEFVANETVKVTAINKQTTEKSKIKVIKTLENNEKLSEEDLEKIEFRFKVNVYSDAAHTKRLKDESGNDISEEIITATMSRSTNDAGEGIWIWTAESKEYTWAYGNYPYYTVEEIDECSVHGTECKNDTTCTYKTIINFNKDATIAQNNGNTSVEVTDTGLRGQFTKNGIENGVFDALLTNRVNGTVEPEKGIIEIL